MILYFSSILLTCALAGFLAVYAWRQRSVPGSRSYAGLALAICLLAGAEILSMLSPTPVSALFWFRVRYSLMAVAVVLWLVFALEYSGRRDWLSKPMLVGLFVVPVITQMVLWSSPVLGLWVQQEVGLYKNGPFWIADVGARVPGPGFLVHSFYGLILLLASIVLLIHTAWRLRRQSRLQALLVAGAGCIALVLAVDATFNLTPQGEFNRFMPGIGLSVLLIALAVFRFQFLKRVPAASAGSVGLEAESGRSLAMFVLVFVIIAAGIGAAAYLSYSNHEQRFRQQVESQLSSIGALKADGLQVWRRGRINDVEILGRNPAFGALVQRYLATPTDVQTQAELQAWVDRVEVETQIDRVFLLDTAGVERLAAPAASEPLAAHLDQQFAATLSTGETTLLDFHRDSADDAIHLSLLIPVRALQDGGRPSGILLAHIDPYVYLYPYLQQWPVVSASAETLLVRREGTGVLFLNELRFQAGAALNLRFPLEDTKLPAAKAALGQEGIVQGVDYRGVPVIADIRAVPDSPWFLITKMDIAEVYAPLRERQWQTMAFFGALILAAAASLGLVWRQHDLRHLRGRAEAAQTLRESEERFRTLFEQAGVGVALLETRTGQYVRTNQKYCDFLGYTAEELLHRTFHDVTYPDDTQTNTGKDALLIAGTIKEFSLEKRYIQKDGTVVWGNLTTSPLWKPGTEPDTYLQIAVVEDITERKRTEEALRESEERYRRLVELLPDGVVVHSLGHVVFANAASAKIIGAASPAELTGKPVIEFVHPDHREMALGRIRQSLDEGSPAPLVEETFVHLDGSPFAVEVTGVPFSYAGKSAMLTVFNDITERKRQQAQILATWADLQRLLAESDQSRLVLLSILEDRMQAEEEIRRLSAELETRVSERTAQLTAANEEVEAFSYSVSHDLRAPLRTIQGFSTILSEDFAAQLPAEAQRYLQLVSTGAQQMSRLIDDLLTFSRTSRQSPERQRVVLGEVIHRAIEDLQAQQQGRQVEFVIGDLPDCQADPDLLKQVFVNLLGNALKFTRQRDVARIEIGALAIEDGRLQMADWAAASQSAISNQQSAIYYVRDNGTGFDMRYAHKVFGVFQRLHRTEDYEGTGIGLAIVQRIIHRHGGRIWVEAEPDKGATFYFTLAD